MRILVYPHDLNIGGSQINAIDLAALHAEDGHDVVIYGIEGPLVDYVAGKGLPFIPARELRYRPAPSRVAQLASIARTRHIDVIHGYEWPPCLDAYFGAHLMLGVPLVCTVLSMTVSSLVPRSVPLIMGTELLGAEARRTREDVRVLEPPIDVDADNPGIEGTSFRLEHSVRPDEMLIVTVSRLSVELKLDALVDVIDAIRILAEEHPVRLIIVGDGDARPQLEARAAAVNERTARTTVSLVGALADPRAAYAAADVVVGMGSSTLRAMAIGKPVVVQGEGGFSLPFTPETYATFLSQGFWGVGSGGSGSRRLAGHLDALLLDAERRSRLGEYGRTVAVDRFSLRRAADIMEGVYAEVAGLPVRRGSLVGEAAVMASRVVSLEIDQHLPGTKRRRASFEKTRLASAAATDLKCDRRTDGSA
jgi:glycosyltransferase involved in cell wall biosynthesis